LKSNNNNGEYGKDYVDQLEYLKIMVIILDAQESGRKLIILIF